MRIFPDILPGGYTTNPAYDQRFTDIANTINNLIIRIESIENRFVNVVGFVDSSYRALDMHSVQTYNLVGNSLLLKSLDGQMVFLRGDEFSSGSNRTFNILAVKAEYPFTYWTNLAGTFSPDRYTIVENTTLGGSPTSLLPVPFCVQDSITNDIYIFTGRIAATRQFGYYRMTYNATARTWTPAPFVSIYNLNAVGNATCGATALQVDDNTLLLIHVDTASSGNLAHIYRMTLRPTITLTLAQSYAVGGSFPVYGFHKKLVNMGSGRILALLEYFDTNINDRKNLAWAVSTDAGVTWPATPAGAVLPSATSNMRGIRPATQNQNMKFWDAAYLPGVNRVGLIYCGAAVVGQNSGVFYAEFDPTTLTWTAQAAHINLNVFSISIDPHIVADTTSNIRRVTWWDLQGNSINEVSSPRILFYRRSANQDSALTLANWQTAIMPFTSAVLAKVTTEITFAPSGLDVIDGNTYWHMAMALRDTVVNITDFGIKSLNTGVLDA